MNVYMYGRMYLCALVNIFKFTDGMCEYHELLLTNGAWTNNAMTDGAHMEGVLMSYNSNWCSRKSQIKTCITND